MVKVNNINTRTNVFIFIVNFEHISHLSNVSIVDFEQVNVSWVPYAEETLSVLYPDVFSYR